MSALSHIPAGSDTLRSSRTSDAVRVGNLVFVSGVLPVDLDNDKALLPELVEHQTDLILSNLDTILERAGLREPEIVATTIYTTKLKKFSERIGRVYGRRFAGDTLPASSWVGVSELPRGALIAMDFIVHAGASS